MSEIIKDNTTINNLWSEEEEERAYRWYLRESARIRRERAKIERSDLFDEEIVLVRA